MRYAPIPANDAERLKVLYQKDILDTPAEPRFDALTKEAAERLGMPISMVSIIDKEREWFKSCYGLGASEGPRNISFCGHAMLASDIFIIEDTWEDERFKDNPQVVSAPFVRFYAGIALHELGSGYVLGVFCVKDRIPRKLSVTEIGIFLDIAQRAELELNKKSK